ncbi:unnamed protein product [Allacma fusca]|uniref:Transmembrane protein 53 n=1 Tax=Allacma fusca TaxID=39272 RepID=A0A8J2P7G3_9HEXA|nr:unnamed protein product [Allacma fusca]
MHGDLGLSFSVEYPMLEGWKQNQITILEDFENQNTVTAAGDKKTLVVLLGWSGAREKQLAKYSEIYLKRGYIIVRCIIPAKVTYSDVEKLPLLANEIVGGLREHNLIWHPIFFHVFSNGGALLFSYIIREIGLQKNPADFDIRGTIFDSGPCAPTCTSAYRAIKITCSSYTL